MKNAFSLVELSIVLVILGLLTGGILAGQNLIRAAELRSVSTQYQGFITATYTFRDQYFALPGDMRNATDFWGESASCPGTAGTGTQTCDGNGDGTVSWAGANNQYTEAFTYWQHLANAGLIEGSYTGRSGAGSGIHAEAGVNVPTAKLSNAGWSVVGWANLASGDTALFAYDYGNAFSLGASATNLPYEAVLVSPEEIWNVDTKIDDGKPGTGKLLVRWWDTCTDAASNGGSNAAHRTGAEYLLSATGAQCSFVFANIF